MVPGLLLNNNSRRIGLEQITLSKRRPSTGSVLPTSLPPTDLTYSSNHRLASPSRSNHHYDHLEKGLTTVIYEGVVRDQVLGLGIVSSIMQHEEGLTILLS